MDNKGQSALEYLMTYGWALIVIAIVIGVLIFVTSGATGGVICQSQSTGVIVEATSVTNSTAGVVLRNATGSDITYNYVIGSGDFASSSSTTNAGTVTKNDTFVVEGVSYTTPLAAGSTLDNARLIVNYDIKGLDANATVTCSGTV